MGTSVAMIERHYMALTESAGADIAPAPERFRERPLSHNFRRRECPHEASGARKPARIYDALEGLPRTIKLPSRLGRNFRRAKRAARVKSNLDLRGDPPPWG
jgi:hypothetical protein